MKTKKVYLVNPPDGSDGKLHLTKDMAGGFLSKENSAYLIVLVTVSTLFTVTQNQLLRKVWAR